MKRALRIAEIKTSVERKELFPQIEQKMKRCPKERKKNSKINPEDSISN